MQIRKLFTLLFFLLFTTLSISQQATVGTVLNGEESLQGYTFFSPFSGTRAYIVDNCGQLVNQWNRGTRPGLAAYFLDNGLMMRTYKADELGPFTSASNAGGLELVDWDNNTVWSYEFNTLTELSHHDAVYMPNGHILVLIWELVYTDEIVELGRDPNEIAVEGFMWSEKIWEVEPVGSNDINVVWEWQIKHHYIQDFDETKSNFGVVSEHPELFDINLPELNSSNSNSTRDWNHFNAIDYNEELDQILISTRNSDEIWIIDHSTTTEQAASHSGGKYGKGGDILYRWGNGSAYDRAPVSDQKLFGQHGTHWIKDGPDAGKILIFNNGSGRPGTEYSTVEILSPAQDSAGFYTTSATEPFGPATSEWKYGDQPGENFFSRYLSNAQRLSNGNTLVNSGSPGDIFEITPNRDRVWHYVIPLFSDFPAEQGGNAGNNANFRAYKYPADYSGFEGIDLTPGATIETGNSPVNCTIISGTNDNLFEQLDISIKYYPADQNLEILNPNLLKGNIKLLDVAGRQHFTQRMNQSEHLFRLNVPVKGIYFFQIITDDGRGYTGKIALF